MSKVLESDSHRSVFFFMFFSRDCTLKDPQNFSRCSSWQSGFNGWVKRYSVISKLFLVWRRNQTEILLPCSFYRAGLSLENSIKMGCSLWICYWVFIFSFLFILTWVNRRQTCNMNVHSILFELYRMCN